MDLVSIYIPTHNRRELLQRAVRSALEQSYPSVEVVVCDDGSTDGTAQWLAEQAARHANLRVLRNDSPKGACAARNRAIAAAHGRFVTGLDDDDVLHPDHVAVLQRAYDHRYAFVCASCVGVYPNKRVPYRQHAGVITLSSALHYNKIGNQVFVLKERVLAVGGYDDALPAFQDYDLWVRLMQRFGPALKLRDTTYECMKTGHPRISDSIERRLQALAMFREKHRALLSDAHLRSLELVERRIRGHGIDLLDVPYYAVPGNRRATLSAYVNHRFGWVQGVYHKLLSIAPHRGGGTAG